jgi:broad specificity phosphatase PhoE
MKGYYIMRHFERDANPEFHANLNAVGRKRALEFELPGVQRVVTSPFARCVQSVEHFVSRNGLSAHISCALGEFIDDTAHGIGLETIENMRQRVDIFLESDAQLRDNALTLYVTHGSVADHITGEDFQEGDVHFIP